MERIRLILADDEAPVLEAMCELVSTDQRIDVVGTARDASEAIDLAQRHTPDVAMLDVRMPGGGGSRAAREIRRLSPATRIIALSATTDPRTVVSMVRAGAVGYVGKDQPVEEVLRAIHRSADGRSSMSVDRLGDVAEQLIEYQARDHMHVAEPALVSADRIRQAIRGDILETVFQPIVDLDDGRIQGLEALSRFMTRPRRSPETWFTEAARHGLLIELELAAARKALGHMHLVPEGIYLSVNASAETMCAPELPELLQQVPADRVVLELTERSPIADRHVMAEALATLRSLGARLALDDVGKGFSGLGNVLEYTPDFLKFDRALVSGVDTDVTKRALIDRLTAFADEVGVEVVAEGIESPAEVETLRAVGVRNGQGFLLGRPGPIPPRTSEVLTWPGAHGPSVSLTDERVRTPA